MTRSRCTPYNAWFSRDGSDGTWPSTVHSIFGPPGPRLAEPFVGCNLRWTATSDAARGNTGLATAAWMGNGEGLGVECHVGFMQRPERYVILGFGTIFGVLLTFATGGTPTAGPVPLLVLTLLVIAVLLRAARGRV